MTTTAERLEAQGWELVDPDLFSRDATDMELTSAEQLRALADPFRLRLFGGVSRQPGSAKELAGRFDVPTTRLYHHLDLLEEHGFIEVVATRRSGARTERCYGAPSRRSIRPGPDLVDAEDRSELGDLLRTIAEVVGATLAERVRTRPAGGVPTGEDGGEDMVAWSNVRLTQQQREDFAAEFADLTERIAAASMENKDEAGSDAEPTTVFVVLVPDPLSGD